MSVNSRNGATGAKGSHWQEPLMVSGGPLDDVARGPVDNAVGVYKVYYEDFKEQMAASADGLNDSGWLNTDINSATSATETVTGLNGALFLNPGSKADAGMELQFNAVAVSGADNAAEITTHQILPEFLQPDTLFDGKEIFFQTRIGSVSDSATDNDSKYIIGFFQNDTSLLNSGSGVPSVVAGGGFGFVKAELGGVTGVSTNAAITAAGTALDPAVSELALDGAATITWHTYAARCRVIDASAGTGFTDFWYDGIHSLRLATVPFDATDTHSFTLGLVNGPSQIADWHVDYILTGWTRPGLTWPYTDGTPY